MERLRKLIGMAFIEFYSIIALLAIWVGAIIASGNGFNPFNVKWDFANTGAFGDSFGPIAALMASVAAISAIAAFRAQATEIVRVQERQRQEDQLRAEQRSLEDKRQADRDIRAEKQIFEDTFFKLIESFRGLVSQIDINSGSGRSRTAHDAFASMLRATDQLFHSYSGNMQMAWAETEDRFSNDLGHYLRFLYHIVLFVDNSSIKNKYFYIRFLRAMLSESELGGRLITRRTRCERI